MLYLQWNWIYKKHQLEGLEGVMFHLTPNTSKMEQMYKETCRDLAAYTKRKYGPEVGMCITQLADVIQEEMSFPDKPDPKDYNDGTDDELYQ